MWLSFSLQVHLSGISSWATSKQMISTHCFPGPVVTSLEPSKKQVYLFPRRSTKEKTRTFSGADRNLDQTSAVLGMKHFISSFTVWFSVSQPPFLPSPPSPNYHHWAWCTRPSECLASEWSLPSDRLVTQLSQCPDSTWTNKERRPWELAYIRSAGESLLISITTDVHGSRMNVRRVAFSPTPSHSHTHPFIKTRLQQGRTTGTRQ